MKRHLTIAALLVTGLLAAGCARTATVADHPSPATGVLRVTQQIEGPLYVEGSVGYVRITDGSGVVFVGKVPQEGLTRTLEAGTFTLRSYQRICGGNCGNLGHPTDRCQASVTVTAGGTVHAEVRLTPTKNTCSISLS
jgi:hypothetical protein